MDNHEKLHDQLQAEYLYIQNVIESFDSKFLTIKTWSISFSFAAIGIAYSNGEPALLLLALISSCTFWLIEGLWKTFQYGYYGRSEKLEEFFAGDETTIKPFQIGKSWFESWSKIDVQELFRMMSWYHVMLPHFIIVILSIILFYLHLTGIYPITND